MEGIIRVEETSIRTIEVLVLLTIYSIKVPPINFIVKYICINKKHYLLSSYIYSFLKNIIYTNSNKNSY
jgi:hypothetical protein